MRRVLVVAVAVGVLFLLTAAVALAGPPSPDATYMGADVCKACHADKYEAVFQTRHPWKIRPVDDPGVEIIADWTTGEDVRTTLMDDGQERPFTLDDVDYVIGAKPGWKQRYIKVIDGAWRILPAQFNLATQEWVPYHADQWMERDYREKCAGCHTTGYDPETLTWVDFGVTCEGCHGPGSEHVAAGGGEDTAIYVPTNDSQVCARCHVRGKDVNGYGWPQDLWPGSGVKVEDVFTFVTIEDGKIWPDGTASKSHHQQYIDWKGSKHAAAGVGCISCHDAHGSEYERDLMKDPKELCVGCHTDKADLAAHQPYMADAFAADPDTDWCVACHMPKMAKSAVAYDISAHTWKQPNPAGSVEFGLDNQINACNQCHTDETAEWAVEQISAAEAAPAELPTTGGVLPGVMPLVVSGVSLLALGAGAAYLGRRKR